MKILHVYDYFAPGNSRNGFDLDRLLAARGHAVDALAAVGPRGPADGARLEGVSFHTYPFRDDLSILGRYRSGRRVNRERFEALHRERRYDLVLLNQPLSARGVLDAPSAREVPFAYWFLSPWAAEWRAANPGAGALRRLFHGGLRNRLEGGVLRECRAIMVASEFMGRQLREHHPGIPGGAVTLVPGAVDLGLFCPDGAREPGRRRFGIGPGPVALTVRRLVHRMGIDLLLRAAASVPGLEVVIGGDGPLRRELEALAGSLGVRAKFVGYVPDADLPALYRAADVFVLPTRALEGFGLAAIEAMACGTPALGTPVGAIPEVLGPLGLVFGDATPEAIAEGLRRFFEKPDADLPRRCRDYVASRYDWNGVASKVEELFLRVIREGPGHGRG